MSNLMSCDFCKNGRYVLSGDPRRPVPCYVCNPSGSVALVTVERCLGCGCDLSRRDCGCPAGSCVSIEVQ